MRLKAFTWDFKFPALSAPEWASQVERWYQMDAPSYGLTEVFWRNQQQIGMVDKPAWIFLASPGGSNPTDQLFTQSESPSPAKFVHTLPNIRSAALLQVMKWSGSVLCIQNDPNTIWTALNEAVSLIDFRFSEGEDPQAIWVAGVTVDLTAFILILGQDGAFEITKNSSLPMAKSEGHDKPFLNWLKSPQTKAYQGPGLGIVHERSGLL